MEIPAGEGMGKGPLKLTATKLQLKSGERRLVLSGKVKLQQGKLRLSCRTLSVQMDSAQGKTKARANKLLAKGGVKLSLGDSKGSAEEVLLDPTSGSLHLTGAPTLRWAPLGLTIEGRKISLDLTKGLLSVDAARVNFSPPPANPGKKQP